jgi:lysophospholipase L1-like esterase
VISEGENLNTVGKSTGDSELRINKSGRIEVRGSHVANYQITSKGLEKITNEGGWFITNDLGQLNQGFLCFLGRADDIINIGGLKVSPEDIERKLFKLLDISYGVTITKIDDTIRGETLLLNILIEHSSKLKKIQECIHTLLTDMNIKLGGQISVQVLSQFPFTDTGKIQRKVLSEKYQQQANETKDINAFSTLTEKLVHNLNLPFISDLDSFLSLNGDSLMLMLMSIEIEQHIGYLPENWEAMSFGHLNDFTRIINEPSEKKKYSYGWLLTLLICALIIGELFLQIRSHVNTGRSAFNLINDKSTVVFNKELGVKTYRPNIQIRDYKTGLIKYDINQLGLRSPTIEKQPIKEELRIAIVGASTVAGAYASTNYSTFPALLEQRLRDKNRNLVNVINGGVDGLTLNGISSIIEKIILPLKPKYVVIYTGFNDITSICHKQNSNSAPKLQPFLPPTKMPSWLMTTDMIKKNTVFLRKAPKNKNTYIDVDTIDTSWHRNKIESIVTKIISHGVTPVLMTNARSYVNIEIEKARELATTSLYYYYCLDFNSIIKVGEDYNDNIRDVARLHNLHLIDLAKTMPGGHKYFVDGGHFTLKGEKLVAQQLYEFFQSNK